MDVSVVIPAHNEGENLADTVECIFDNTDYPAFEVIVADDGSADGSSAAVERRFGRGVTVVRGQNLGVAGARNLGAEHAGGDILIFLDGHCYVQPAWMAQLAAPLAEPQTGMVGPGFADLRNASRHAGYGAMWRSAMLDMNWLPRQGDQPYPAPLLPGGCQAMRRADFERLGGFDRGMTRWGSEDHEISLRFWLMGFAVVAQPQTLIHHLFRNRQAYPVDQAQIAYNRLRTALLHFSPARLGRVIDCFKGSSHFAQIMIWLLHSDVMARRAQLLAARCRDDDWYFAYFHHDI